ncbi:hypothetical protein Pmani_026803 [Petrolisthes manimaculis]|uniref:Uncharacterized protein n=1 Tax=Petrolisthes manimaculis TaxID=1843537 RepID=A0AAE1P2V9_9EUCA|nr:hypothetical protein Pmani_026803 [Petrolisthes manimaculis]
MLLYLTLALFLGLAHSQQEYEMCYSLAAGSEEKCMTVEVNASEKTIHYHMTQDDEFEDVETLEDFNTGFSASRIESQEACQLRALPMSFGDQIAFLKGHQNMSSNVEGYQNVMAVPLDDPEAEVGELLANFCAELPAYKMVVSEGNEEEMRSLEDRQVSVTFRRCYLCFLIAKCFITSITVPTGNTISFFWFFG